MEPSLKIGIFSKSLLAGLLSGVCAAVLNLVYSIIYRNATGFATAEIIMPLSIFIGFPILLAMAGCAYYLLQKHLRAGTSCSFGSSCNHDYSGYKTKWRHVIFRAQRTLPRDGNHNLPSGGRFDPIFCATSEYLWVTIQNIKLNNLVGKCIIRWWS